MFMLLYKMLSCYKYELERFNLYNSMVDEFVADNDYEDAAIADVCMYRLEAMETMFREVGIPTIVLLEHIEKYDLDKATALLMSYVK